MKRIYILLLFAFACITVSAQTQQGIVKTRGRMDTNGNVTAGVRLSGATISIRNSSSYVSGNKGTFSFAVPSKTFSLSNVKKNGYQLCDQDLIGRSFSYSSNPFTIVMETPDNILADRLAAEKKIRRTLTRQLEEKEDEIDELKRQKKISDQEYNKLIQELYENQKKNNDLIEEMAQRYSTIDFDELDDFQRKVAFYIQNGELTRADSLLNTKGSMEERSAELDRMDAAIKADAEELARRQKAHKKTVELKAKTLEDFAADCYSHFEISKIQHRNDSAAYWLELRASKDTLNIDWLLDAGNFIDVYLADYNRADQYYHRALRNAIAQHGEIHPSVALSYNNLAVMYRLQGRLQESYDFMQKAIEIRNELFGEDSQEQIISYDNLGVLFEEMGDIGKAMDCISKALSIATSIGDESHIAYLYNNLAGVYKRQGDYAKALAYYQQSLDRHIYNSGEETPEVANIYSNIGSTYKDLGDYTKSIEYYQKALNICERIFEGNHPLVSAVYNNLGTSYFSYKKYDLSKECMEKALAIDKEIFGDNHPNVAVEFNNLGNIYCDFEEYDKAIEYFNKSKDIYVKLYGEDNYRLTEVYNSIGICYQSQREYDKAILCFQKAIDITLQTFGEKNPDILTYCVNLGITHRFSGDLDKSMECYQYALHIATEVQAENPNVVATIYNAIGRLYYALNKNQESLEYFNKALDKRIEIFGKEHPEVPRLYGNIAAIYSAQKNYEMAIKNYKEELAIELKLYGADSQDVFQTSNMIGFTYFTAKEENVKIDGFEDFMSEVIFVGITAQGDSPAAQQGLSGEYAVLEYEDWSIEQISSITDYVKAYQNKPKNIVVMKDDVISKHYFENTIGMKFVLKYVGKEGRKKTIEAYKQWKQS